MIDPRERVLEHALRTHFRADEELDLTREVLAAWRRGVRGSGVDPKLLERAGEASPQGRDVPAGGPASIARPTASRFRRVAALLVAAGGAAAAATWLWVAASPRALGIADRAVPTLDGASPAVRTAELRPGRAAVVPDGEPLGVALRGGGRLAIDPPAAFRLDENEGGLRVGLGLGRVRVEAARGAIAVDSGFGTVELAPGAVVVFDVELADGGVEVGPTADVLAPDRAALGALALDAERVPRTLRARLETGTATLLADGAGRSLEPGADVALASAPPLDEAELAGLADLVAALYLAERPAAALDARDELSRFLAGRPMRWAALRAMTLSAAAGAPEEAQPLERWDGLLDFLALDPAPDALALARRIWALRPDLVPPEAVVYLAERGAFELEREVRALVEHAPEGALFAASYLAFRGDARGRAILERAARATAPGPDLVSGLLAAVALEALGDSRPWEAALGVVEDAVDAALASGDLGRARALVAEAEVFDRLLLRAGVPRLAELRPDLVRSVAAAAEDADGPEALRARMAEVARH